MSNWEKLKQSPDPQERFVYWVMCREQVRIRKKLGEQPPFTEDYILANHKFCNVSREDDAVTIDVKRRIRQDTELLQDTYPHRMILNLAIARLFNHPSTFIIMGLPILTIKKTTINDACAYANIRKEVGEKMLRGAYMVTPHGSKNKGIPTYKYIARIVRNLHEAVAEHLVYTDFATLAKIMLKAYGWQDFMVNQLCADLRYTPWFKAAPDWETFVLAGPGTRRGINRYYGATEKNTINSLKGGSQYFTEKLLDIRSELLSNKFRSYFSDYVLKAFRDPNNLSNCFCEFDKYERARDCVANGKRITLKRYKPSK